MTSADVIPLWLVLFAVFAALIGALVAAGIILRAEWHRAKDKKRKAPKPARESAHPDFGCEPLTTRERAALARMEQSLASQEREGDS